MQRIPSLGELTIGHRIAITMGIVMVILFALALFGFLTGGWDQAEGAYQIQSAIPGQPASTWDDRMFALDRDAVDEAYKDHLKKLFGVMLTAGDVHASERAIHGAMNMRKIYVQIMENIDKREKASQEELKRKQQ